MKYLKLFELFDSIPEPELFYDGSKPISPTNDYTKYNNYFDLKLPWDENEKEYFGNIIERNKSKIYESGYSAVYRREGITMFYIMLYPVGSNSNFIELYVHKLEDDYYFAQVIQTEDEGGDRIDLRYMCDGFDSLKILIDKWL